MARVEGEIIIQRPPDVVFDFVADERNEPLYNPHMLVAELISAEPIGLGSRFHTELQTRGRTLPMTVEFTEFDRPRRLASATHSSMMDTTGALTFEPESGGTRMRWSWDVQPRRALRLIPLVVSQVGRRQERTIWANLKRLLESGAHAQPGFETPHTTATAPAPDWPTSPAGAPATSASGTRNVLVAFASAHGSTQGIADRIAARLRERGMHVDALSVDDVKDLDAYDAVIVGSAVHNQSWIPTASTFVRENASALTDRRVWLFSVGSFGDTHGVIGRFMRPRPAPTFASARSPLSSSREQTWREVTGRLGASRQLRQRDRPGSAGRMDSP